MQRLQLGTCFNKSLELRLRILEFKGDVVDLGVHRQPFLLEREVVLGEFFDLAGGFDQ